jgi:phosphatidylserine/phosphatidylglycerophosphate/cardiolipin synthase-like enzyme
VDPNEEMAASRTDLRTSPFWERLHALGDHERFTLAGIARNGNNPGEYQNAYVHAKIALIDDVWATIGSANIANRSFYGNRQARSLKGGRAVSVLSGRGRSTFLAEEPHEVVAQAIGMSDIEPVSGVLVHFESAVRH